MRWYVEPCHRQGCWCAELFGAVQPAASCAESDLKSSLFEVASECHSVVLFVCYCPSSVTAARCQVSSASVLYVAALSHAWEFTP